MKKSFAELQHSLKTHVLTCSAVVDDYLSEIESKKSLNALITVFDRQKLLSRAEQIDRKIQTGTQGRLAGMIVAVKDAIMVKNERNTCGSRILRDYVSPYDATVVERLELEDAIIIGKANLDEFAMGSSNENSAFGSVMHPEDHSRVPGGSSGGSAVCVAAGMAMASLGSETGGSVRLPASFCGLAGLKPTYGRISRYGLSAFASSFDQIGPMANNVDDLALVTEIIAGHDPKDSTTSTHPVDSYSAKTDLPIDSIRIGVPKEYFIDGIDPDIEKAVREVINRLKERGATIVDISLPHSEYGIATYYILTTAEASSNLARYDGVRYTHRSAESENMMEMFINSRSEGFGPEVKRRIMLGTYVLSSGYYDAYYKKAQKVRTLIKRDFERVFTGPESVNCILAPTSPTTAFKIGEKLNDPLSMYLSDIFTVNVNLAGIPSLNVPCGRDHQNLPIGIQVMAPHFCETMCFRVGRLIEKIQHV